MRSLTTYFTAIVVFAMIANAAPAEELQSRQEAGSDAVYLSFYSDSGCTQTVSPSQTVRNPSDGGAFCSTLYDPNAAYVSVDIQSPSPDTITFYASGGPANCGGGIIGQQYFPTGSCVPLAGHYDQFLF